MVETSTCLRWFNKFNPSMSLMMALRNGKNTVLAPAEEIYLSEGLLVKEVQMPEEGPVATGPKSEVGTF